MENRLLFRGVLQTLPPGFGFKFLFIRAIREIRGYYFGSRFWSDFNNPSHDLESCSKKSKTLSRHSFARGQLTGYSIFETALACACHTGHRPDTLKRELQQCLLGSFNHT